MKLQAFSASGTFTWPDDITHVDYWLVGGGGGGANSTTTVAGGGGKGGQVIGGTVYRHGESSLSVTVGAGGNANSDGGDTYISQSGTELNRAKGGKGATGITGATSATSGGGSGGGGSAPGYGGGGGAASGGSLDGVGSDGPPGGTGHGGEATPGFLTGGKGGNGGDESAGADGHVPGGGGGGAGAVDGVAHSGGKGGAGKVVFIWGEYSGITLASSGCCCGQCDLTKTGFPKNVNLHVDLTLDDPPGFDANHYDAGSVDSIHYNDPCNDYFDQTTSTVVGGEHDGRVIDQGFMSLIDDATLRLEQTSFSSGYGTIAAGGGGETGWYCRAAYESPLAPGFADDGIFRANKLGPHPSNFLTSEAYSSYSSHGDGGSEDYPHCGGCVPYTVDLFLEQLMSDVWAYGRVDLEISLSELDYKYYYSVGVTLKAFFAFETNRQYTVGDPGGDTSTAMYSRTYGPGTNGIVGADGGPYDTGQEALEAARISIDSMLAASSGGGGYELSWSYHDGLADSDTSVIADGTAGGSQAYVTYSNITCCPPLPNCFRDVLPGDETYHFAHCQSHHSYASEVYFSVSW